MKITESGKLIPEKGFHQYEISGNEIDLQIEFQTDCELFVRICKASCLRITSLIHKGVHVSLLYWNETQESVVFEENYEVRQDGSLILAYGECNDADTIHQTDVLLCEPQAEAVLSSASLVSSKKEYRIKTINRGVRTSADIRNYAVVLKDGKLMIDAIGKIERGAKRSQSHQTSRALEFEEGQCATILPELLIDENDVQASHAMSIGRVDENQLYYMMSRGLDLKQCTMLISQGYLLPVTDFISDEKIRETLKMQLERKIQESCLM